MPFRVSGQTTVTRAFSAIVRSVDPDFDKDRRREPEYEFFGKTGKKRVFYSDVRKRGVYAGHN